MILYSATRAEFTADVYANVIESKILEAFRARLGHTTSGNEVESWKNSMQYMNNALVKSDIPGDAGVAIEYKIPLTSKRIDFIVSARLPISCAGTMNVCTSKVGFDICDLRQKTSAHNGST